MYAHDVGGNYSSVYKEVNVYIAIHIYAITTNNDSFYFQCLNGYLGEFTGIEGAYTVVRCIIV